MLSSRKSATIIITIIIALAVIFGSIWVVLVSFIPGGRHWGDIIKDGFTILTTLVTSVALFSILTLWPDPKQDAREKIDQFMLDYIELRDSKAAPYALAHIVGNIRAKTSLAQYTSKSVRGYLESVSEGERIAGLSIVQQQWYKDRPNPSPFSRALKFLVSIDNTKQEENDRYFDKLVNEYFDDVVAILGKPKTAFEHFQAILVIAYESHQAIWAKEEAEQAKKGIMFHLSAEQQLKLCIVVNNYEYEGDDAHTSKEWYPFKKLVYQECFDDIVEILGKPETACEHSKAIEAMVGIVPTEEQKKEAEQAKGMMFHLSEEQQQEVCKVVNNYKYEGNHVRTSQEWDRFKTLVHEQTWCK
jgi:hypothetical protein